MNFIAQATHFPATDNVVFKMNCPNPNLKSLNPPESHKNDERQGQGQEGKAVSDKVDGHGIVLGLLRYGWDLDGLAIVVIRPGIPVTIFQTTSSGVT